MDLMAVKRKCLACFSFFFSKVVWHNAKTKSFAKRSRVSRIFLYNLILYFSLITIFKIIRMKSAVRTCSDRLVRVFFFSVYWVEAVVPKNTTFLIGELLSVTKLSDVVVLSPFATFGLEKSNLAAKLFFLPSSSNVDRR